MLTVRKIVTDLLKNKSTPKYLLIIYEFNPRFWLYALICGIGVWINMAVLLFLVSIFPLWISNLFAIIVAGSWNYINSLGRLRKYWGL